MTNSTKKDHAIPITTAASTAKARATTRLSHKELISIYVEAIERPLTEQEAPVFARTTSDKLLLRVSTSNSLHKVPTLSWPLCSASSTSLATVADKTATSRRCKPIHHRRISLHLCNRTPTSSIFATRNKELTIQPTWAAVTTPDNIITKHTEAATATATMAASTATKVAKHTTTTTEETPEALVVDQEAADIDQQRHINKNINKHDI